MNDIEFMLSYALGIYAIECFPNWQSLVGNQHESETECWSCKQKNCYIFNEKVR